MEDLRLRTRLTKERVLSIISKVPTGFLMKAEAGLLIHVLFQYERAIAFTDLECSTFSQKYYPDYVIRAIPHQPWQRKPIQLLQSRHEEVIRIMKEQMSSRKYEPSSASYHLTFFTVEKKGSDLRVIHDLQPLNAVTVQDATLPPHIDNMIESFSSRAIYGLFDLKSGYDSRVLTTISRYLTSFYVEGMGLQIRIFIWEYMKAVQELLARVQESGVTISGSKMVLATPHLQLLGAEVALDSAHISHEVTAKLAKWPTCQNPTEVCSFLGTVRVIRHWICDFAKIVKTLMALTKKMALHKFEWSEEAQDAMELLKHLATTAVPV